MQGDDLNAATTRINLALPPSSTAKAPRKITEEERGHEAAKTLRDAKFRARHEGQRGLRAAKRLTRSKPPCTLFIVYFPLLSLVPRTSKSFATVVLSPPVWETFACPHRQRLFIHTGPPAPKAAMNNQSANLTLITSIPNCVTSNWHAQITQLSTFNALVFSLSAGCVRTHHAIPTKEM